MARIDSQVLFLTTSPRTPEKMIPEINLLIKNFQGLSWDSDSQTQFMNILRQEQFFNGKGENDPAFSARDRINRAPKALGFVKLYPKIEVTPAGETLISSKHSEEIFLRQFMKFQIPSPYHKPSDKAAYFWIKPYLEMLRLVRVMGSLKFDELQIFGMQLTNWKDFDFIVDRIKQFRFDKHQNQGSYRKFKTKVLHDELKQIYSTRIDKGELKTRESNDKSLAKFLKTQGSNMRDYADSCFRYLRATGLVNVSHIGKSLSIIPERMQDVDYILDTIDRNPCFVDDEVSYAAYLGDCNQPVLLSDNREIIVKRLQNEFTYGSEDIQTTKELKDLLIDLTDKRKEDTIQKQIKDIKAYKFYDDIQHTFEQIKKGEVYDAPLMLEWNTWRAMTMLDGGDIKANLNFDDFGNPLSTAAGNMSDIICDYDDYMLSVEVTMATGQRQYDMEGEPVSRHLGNLKRTSQKTSYALFVAPTINEATIAHFYALHRLNVSYYGGESIIVPLTIDLFQKMLEDSYIADYVPTPERVRDFFELSMTYAKEADNENDWYTKIRKAATCWF